MSYKNYPWMKEAVFFLPCGQPDMSPFLKKTQPTTWYRFDFIGPLQFSKTPFLTKINTYSKYELSFLLSRPQPVPLYKGSEYLIY